MAPEELIERANRETAIGLEMASRPEAKELAAEARRIGGTPVGFANKFI